MVVEFPVAVKKCLLAAVVTLVSTVHTSVHARCMYLLNALTSRVHVCVYLCIWQCVLRPMSNWFCATIDTQSDVSEMAAPLQCNNLGT